jgi:hypothetical protein
MGMYSGIGQAIGGVGSLYNSNKQADLNRQNAIDVANAKKA